ncbi:MAG: patatin-like phospholipase family protein [Rhodoferax sp.]
MRQNLLGWLARWSLLAAMAVLLAACSVVPRLDAPPALLDAAQPADYAPDVRLLSLDLATFRARAPRFFADLRNAANGGSLDMLSLSGGGSGGAYGAGVLVGLTRAHTRPNFELVTGVSAGALIAPFAFLGPAWDDRLETAFAGAQRQPLLNSPTLNLLGLMMWPAGAGQRNPLFDLVDGFVTPEMIDAVARESAHGRRLIIATTDLDKQETVLWDMGVIAARGGPAARELFRNVLVASASVPGVFPPVLIPVRDGAQHYDEMHVDGSVTTPVFVAPLIAAVHPRDVPQLRGARLYMIINGPLAHLPTTSPFKTLDVLSASFLASMTYRTREAIVDTTVLTRHFDVQFELTEIPADYPLDTFVDFDPAHMRALFDFGERCAAQAQLWLSPEQSINNNFRGHQAPQGKTPLCPAAMAR